MKPKIGYCGMSHLGLVSAVAAARLGHTTIGFDPDEALIARLRDGTLPVHEPGLSEATRASVGLLQFSASTADLSRCDVVYIALDVQTDDKGVSDLRPLNALCRLVAPHVRPDATIVMLSQVSPGTTRQLWTKDSRFFYQVETLVFGQAMDRALKPERITVGCASAETPLPQSYNAFLSAFGCPILPMRFESAEFAKISINMCLAASLAVTNTLAEVCEAIGADWSEIVPVLRLDKRIGAHAYLGAGLGIGGSNIGRDIATVIRIGADKGTNTVVPRAWLANSDRRREWALSILSDCIARSDARIGVLGLAYKEDTDSVRNSPAVALISALKHIHVSAFDPAVAVDEVGLECVERTNDPLSTCVDADAIAIMTPWAQFRQIDPAAIARAMRGNLVVDPYRTLDPAACAAAGLKQIVLGRSEAI